MISSARTSAACIAAELPADNGESPCAARSILTRRRTSLSYCATVIVLPAVVFVFLVVVVDVVVVVVVLVVEVTLFVVVTAVVTAVVWFCLVVVVF